MAAATRKRLPDSQAVTAATAKASSPAASEEVAVMMAGKAMTDSVTYGT